MCLDLLGCNNRCRPCLGIKPKISGLTFGMSGVLGFGAFRALKRSLHFLLLEAVASVAEHGVPGCQGPGRQGLFGSPSPRAFKKLHEEDSGLNFSRFRSRLNDAKGIKQILQQRGCLFPLFLSLLRRPPVEGPLGGSPNLLLQHAHLASELANCIGKRGNLFIAISGGGPCTTTSTTVHKGKCANCIL